MGLNNDDVIEFRTVVRFARQNFINVYHYQVSGKIGAGATQLECGTAIEDNLKVELLQCLPPSAEYQGFGVKKIFPTVTAESLRDTGADNGENAGEEVYAAQAAAVITLRSDLAPPGVRGRKYYGPLPVAIVDDQEQEIDATGIGLFTDVLNVLTSNVLVTGVDGSCNVTPVIWSRNDQLAWQITSGVVRHGLGTQRRRAGITRPDAAIFS